MKIDKYDENKIFYTNDILNWVNFLSKEKDSIVITPLTKLSDLFNLKSKSVLRKMIDEIISETDEEIFNDKKLVKIVNSINDLVEENILEVELAIDKIIKYFLEVNEDLVLNDKLVNKYISLLDKYSTKQINIYISGFNVELINYSMVNIMIVTSNLKNIINWSNIESLVMLSEEENFEIINKEKFLSWLELKTKMVISIKDIDDYFNGNINMNTFLIEKAIREI